MTPELFKSIVAYYGESNIIGIGFDNSAGITFPNAEFNLNTNYIESIQCLQFQATDSRGNPYFVVKHIDHLQSIQVRDQNVLAMEYDMVTIRG